VLGMVRGHKEAPWEGFACGDFAEAWAYCLPIVEALQTVAAFGLRILPAADRHRTIGTTIDFDSCRQADFDALTRAWLPLTCAANSRNLSMGQTEIYPFVLAPEVRGKLRFIHDLIHQEQGDNHLELTRQLFHAGACNRTVGVV